MGSRLAPTLPALPPRSPMPSPREPASRPRPLHAVRSAVAVISSIVILASGAALTVFLLLPDLAEEYTVGLRPTQFYDPLDPDLLADELDGDYARVFAVAHNSGGSVDATLEALAHGADAIEIDVVALDGRLYASHAPPLPIIGRRAFRGPALETIWTAGAQTDLVKLDLKQSSPAYLDLVLDFLAAHQRRHQVIVATSDEASLRRFAERMPDAFRFASVGDEADLRALHENRDLVALIDGVSIRADLLDQETAGWLSERDLLALAWTVDDIKRANELIRLGVDAITTDNLALMALLGGQERGEARLARTGDVEEATPVVNP